MDLIEVGPALETPATRRVLTRSIAFFAAVLVLGLALTGLGIAWRSDQRQSTLAQRGEHAVATVMRVEDRANGRAQAPNGIVTLQFDTGSHRVTTTVDVGRDKDRYQVDDTVAITYDPREPTLLVIDGQTMPEPPGVPWLLIVLSGGLLVLSSGIALRHLHATRRVLQNNEWLAMTAELRTTPLQIGRQQRGLLVVVLTNTANGVTIAAEPLGLKRLGSWVEPRVWVAGFGQRRFVVGAPGGGRLVLVRSLEQRRKVIVPDHDIRLRHGRHRHG